MSRSYTSSPQAHPWRVAGLLYLYFSRYLSNIREECGWLFDLKGICVLGPGCQEETQNEADTGQNISAIRAVRLSRKDCLKDSQLQLFQITPVFLQPE
jgi:hypothetical protein